MKLLVSFARAACMRCPNCGAGGLRSGWIGTVARCPICRLRLDRGETDYFLGAYTINLLGALVIAAALAVLAALRPGWPSVLIYGAGVTAIVLFALWFYPFSRLLWLAFDLALRPLRPSDFEGA